MKVAAMSRKLSDSTRLLQLAQGTERVVAVPMGEIGLPARILALRAGSALLYAPVATATAPGQVGLREMKELYRAHQFTLKTRVFGVIGNPVGHSLSPLLHNTGYAAAKKDAVFLPFLVEDLREFLKVRRELGVVGFSVTIPAQAKDFRLSRRMRTAGRRDWSGEHCDSAAQWKISWKQHGLRRRASGARRQADTKGQPRRDLWSWWLGTCCSICHDESRCGGVDVRSAGVGGQGTSAGGAWWV